MFNQCFLSITSYRVLTDDKGNETVILDYNIIIECVVTTHSIAKNSIFSIIKL